MFDSSIEMLYFGWLNWLLLLCLHLYVYQFIFSYLWIQYLSYTLEENLQVCLSHSPKEDMIWLWWLPVKIQSHCNLSSKCVVINSCVNYDKTVNTLNNSVLIYLCVVKNCVNPNSRICGGNIYTWAIVVTTSSSIISRLSLRV